ncbi:MAG TPA: hypothetical protein VMH36_17690 [Alphaproteobacteria bacterium]|nr:hypothetical protein [Alphaproteobacteria bacterium]
MWLEWLTRVMERPGSEAGASNDLTATEPDDVAVALSDSDIAAAEDAMLRFDELAQAPAIV